MNDTIHKEHSLEIALVLNLHGITVFDFSSHTVDYQRIKEIT